MICCCVVKRKQLAAWNRKRAAAAAERAKIRFEASAEGKRLRAIKNEGLRLQKEEERRLKELAKAEAAKAKALRMSARRQSRCKSSGSAESLDLLETRDGGEFKFSCTTDESKEVKPTDGQSFDELTQMLDAKVKDAKVKAAAVKKVSYAAASLADLAGDVSFDLSADGTAAVVALRVFECQNKANTMGCRPQLSRRNSSAASRVSSRMADVSSQLMTSLGLSAEESAYEQAVMHFPKPSAEARAMAEKGGRVAFTLGKDGDWIQMLVPATDAESREKKYARAEAVAAQAAAEAEVAARVEETAGAEPHRLRPSDEALAAVRQGARIAFRLAQDGASWVEEIGDLPSDVPPPPSLPDIPELTPGAMTAVKHGGTVEFCLADDGTAWVESFMSGGADEALSLGFTAACPPPPAAEAPGGLDAAKACPPPKPAAPVAADNLPELEAVDLLPSAMRTPKLSAEALAAVRQGARIAFRLAQDGASWVEEIGDLPSDVPPPPSLPDIPELTPGAMTAAKHGGTVEFCLADDGTAWVEFFVSGGADGGDCSAGAEARASTEANGVIGELLVHLTEEGELSSVDFALRPLKPSARRSFAKGISLALPSGPSQKSPGTQRSETSPDTLRSGIPPLMRAARRFPKPSVEALESAHTGGT